MHVDIAEMQSRRNGCSGSDPKRGVIEFEVKRMEKEKGKEKK